tara:strand:- start:78728 stop:79267 length:540 start_codon:yes stop_codon:yes gene_type:complete
MKQSRYIQLPQACSFIEAASEAYRLETPWNCFITLHLETAGILPIKASQHVRESLHRLGKYHKRNGMPFSYGWTLENAPIKGVHLHLIVHRPHNLPMHPISYYWAVLRLFRIKQSKGILKVNKFWSRQSYETNLSNVISYSLKGLRKGADIKLEEIIGFRLKETKDQSFIYGKRIGWSR